MGNKYQAINNLGATNPAGVIANGTPEQLQSLTNAVSDSRLGVFHCKDARDTQPMSLNNYSCQSAVDAGRGPRPIRRGFPEAALVGQSRSPYKIARIKDSQQIVLIFDGTQCLSSDLAATGGVVPIQNGGRGPLRVQPGFEPELGHDGGDEPGIDVPHRRQWRRPRPVGRPRDELGTRRRDNVVGTPYKFANIRFPPLGEHGPPTSCSSMATAEASRSKARPPTRRGTRRACSVETCTSPSLP